MTRIGFRVLLGQMATDQREFSLRLRQHYAWPEPCHNANAGMHIAVLRNRFRVLAEWREHICVPRQPEACGRYADYCVGFSIKNEALPDRIRISAVEALPSL